MLIPVILCGGSGTRLWPLSTPERPKQFLPLVSKQTLFQETLLRLEGVAGLGSPIIVCNAAHQVLVAEQLREIAVTPAAIVLEPEGRNTAPAIGIAALLATAAATDDRSPDTVLLVLPADHVIADVAAFHQALKRAVAAARAGRLATFGIVPTHPETGYGYIEQGKTEGEWFAAARFVEKPDLATAQKYLRTGGFLWNSGMFVFGARAYLEELERSAPAIAAACRAAAARLPADGSAALLGAEFLACPSDSVDYAVMEKTTRAAVVPLGAGWSDVGSWSALFEALKRDKDNNVLRGDVVALESGGNLVLGGARRVALLGVDNLIVVDAGDTLLILDKDRSQGVKLLQQPSKERTPRT